MFDWLSFLIWFTVSFVHFFPSWITLLPLTGSALSREITPSRSMWMNSWVLHIWPTSQMTAFAHFCTPAWIPPQLSGEGPQVSFADYVEWVLVSCGSACTVDDDASPTPNPMPSQSPPCHEEWQPEPLMPVTTVSSIAEGVLRECEGMDASAAHPPTTESDCLLDMDINFQFGKVENLLPLSLPDSVHLSDSLVPPSHPFHLHSKLS